MNDVQSVRVVDATLMVSTKVTSVAGRAPLLHQIRTGDQPQSGQGTRPDHAADAASARRRGDRIEMLFAAVHRSLMALSLTVSQISAPRRCCDWSIATWTSRQASDERADQPSTHGCY